MSKPHDAKAGEGRRATVSACIISFNEEHNIRDCIDSVSFADDIVVVDSFSTDRTAEIAREAGARVIQREWPGHVAQKNHAVEVATCDWILALDCDERVTPALREAILEILAAPGSHDGYFISRKLNYLGRWLEHGGWFPEWRLRLFRRGRSRWEGIDPHDMVRVDGSTTRIEPAGAGTESAVILHYSFRDLSHQLKVLDRYSEIQAGEIYRAGRRTSIIEFTLRPLWRFISTYVLRLGFLDGLPGYHMAVNHAYGAYMKYARLWEMQTGRVPVRAKSDLVPTRDESQEAGVQ